MDVHRCPVAASDSLSRSGVESNSYTWNMLMGKAQKHIAVVLQLSAYVLAAVLLEIGHRDTHNILLRSDPVVSGHECGDNEIHHPPGQRHQCLACTHSTHRLALLPPTFLKPGIDLSNREYYCAVGDSYIPPYILHSGERGPPSSSSL